MGTEHEEITHAVQAHLPTGRVKHCRLTMRRPPLATGDEIPLPISEDGASDKGIHVWRVTSTERHWHEAFVSIVNVQFEKPHPGRT